MRGDSILLATFVVALVVAFLGGILARAARRPTPRATCSPRFPIQSCIG